MGLARAADLPVVVVGDIDRGGLLAAMFGTLAVLVADQRHIAGFIVNKFRGDPRLLAPGLDMLRAMTGRPSFGVLPWRHDLWLDAEDSLDLDSRPRAAPPPRGAGTLRIAVVRLPRMSNVTDVDPSRPSPGSCRSRQHPGQLDGADLVILPGTPGYRQRPGLAAGQRPRRGHRRPRRTGRPVLGICGGYQCSPARSTDDVESRTGTVPGSACCLPGQVRRRQDARPAVGCRARRACHRVRNPPRGGHRGRRRGLPRWVRGGCRPGHHLAWHLRQRRVPARFLRDLADRAGRDFTPAPDISFADVRRTPLRRARGHDRRASRHHGDSRPDRRGRPRGATRRDQQPCRAVRNGGGRAAVSARGGQGVPSVTSLAASVSQTRSRSPSLPGRDPGLDLGQQPGHRAPIVAARIRFERSAWWRPSTILTAPDFERIESDSVNTRWGV